MGNRFFFFFLVNSTGAESETSNATAMNSGAWLHQVFFTKATDNRPGTAVPRNIITFFRIFSRTGHVLDVNRPGDYRYWKLKFNTQLYRLSINCRQRRLANRTEHCRLSYTEGRAFISVATTIRTIRKSSKSGFMILEISRFRIPKSEMFICKTTCII